LLKGVKRRHNYYLIRYVFEGWKKIKILRQQKQREIRSKLKEYDLRMMAKYFNMFKSNVYDRTKQKLNFEIRGLTQ